MELIPILAFIVLVGTISTFIFATGAYILFKIRERKNGARSVRRPSAYEAELVAPEMAMQSKEALEEPLYNGQEESSLQPQLNGDEERRTKNHKFVRYTSKGYEPVVKTPNGDDKQWR